MKNRVSNINFKKIALFGLVLSMTMLFAQNRGNALGFQGLDENNLASPRVAALGGSFTAVAGDVNTLYINPAGLSALEGFSIALNGSMFNRTWLENQEYRPNRRFVTLPFYLEGLYVPDPANNGMWDHDVFAAGLLDTSYIVNLPDTGLMAYSKEAADFISNRSSLGNVDFKLALPLAMGERTLSLALGVNAMEEINDVDNNATYLDPHIAYSEYGLLPQADGSDTIRMNWYTFDRSRVGLRNTVTLGAAMDVLPWLSAGFNVAYESANTFDLQAKRKVGYFDLYDDNQFMYSYDTLNTTYDGTSIFMAIKSKLGLQIHNDNVSLGLSVSLPYTINRTYNYEKSVEDTSGITLISVDGTENVKMPMGFQLGFMFTPIEDLSVMVDIAQTPYQNAVWTVSNDLEELRRPWVKQEILSFGLEYIALENLALRAGYRSESQVFVPDGAAVRTIGPKKISWSAGLGVDLGSAGSIDLSYIFQDLKYYDQYFSNINYVRDMAHRFILGYSITL